MCGPSAGKVGAGVFTGGLETMAEGMMPDAPGAPTLPQFPGLTPEEKGILDKMGVSLEQFNQMIQGSSASLAQNKDILQKISGLYDAQGNLNQNAINDLKARTQGQLAQAQGVGSAALGYLQNYFGTGGAGGTTSGTDAANSAGVAKTQADVYKAALEGTGAVNAATTQQQARDFQTLKDSLAQRGIMVTGDKPSQATSDSTAGQRAIELFKNNVAAQNSQERLGYIQTLGGQVGQTVGAAGQASGMGMAATNAQLGMSQNAATMGMSQLAPYLQQYQQGLSTMYQPYQNQQLGPYHQAMAQAQATYQGQVGQYNAEMGQQGALMGAFMPAVSFLGMGVNPSAGANNAGRGMGQAQSGGMGWG